MRYKFKPVYDRPETAKWERWFAWRPVTVNNQEIVWLETLERAKCWSGYEPRWEYKFPGEKW